MSYFNLKYLILANKKIFWYLHIHTHLLLLFAVNLERYPFYTHCRWIVPFEDFVLFLYLYLYDLRTLYEGPEIQNGKYSFFDNMFSETQIFKYVALLPLSFTLEVALIESFPPSSEQSSFNAGNPTTALWLWGFGRLVEYKDLCILIQYSVDANKGLIWIVNGAVVQQNMQKSQWTKVLTEGRGKGGRLKPGQDLPILNAGGLMLLYANQFAQSESFQFPSEASDPLTRFVNYLCTVLLPNWFISVTSFHSQPSPYCDYSFVTLVSSDIMSTYLASTPCCTCIAPDRNHFHFNDFAQVPG